MNSTVIHIPLEDDTKKALSNLCKELSIKAEQIGLDTHVTFSPKELKDQGHYQEPTSRTIAVGAVIRMTRWPYTWRGCLT